MAKKRKKLKKKSSFFSPKKLRRWFFRLFLIASGVAIGVLFKPSLIQDPDKRAQVEGIRTQILEANEVGQQRALEVLGESSEAIQGTVDAASEFAEDLSGQNPQVVIQTKVNELKQEVSSLPEKEIRKIKLEFCQDVIEEE